MEEYTQGRRLKNYAMVDSQAETLGRLAWAVYQAEQRQLETHGAKKAMEHTVHTETELAREVTRIRDAGRGG